MSNRFEAPFERQEDERTRYGVSAIQKALMERVLPNGASENEKILWIKTHSERFASLIKEHHRWIEEFERHPRETLEEIEGLLYAPEEIKEEKFSQAV